MGWSFAVQYTQQAQVFRNSHGPAVLQSWQTLTLVGFKGHPHCFIMQNIKYSQTIWWLYFSESSSWVLRVGYFLENLPKKKKKKNLSPYLTWFGISTKQGVTGFYRGFGSLLEQTQVTTWGTAPVGCHHFKDENTGWIYQKAEDQSNNEQSFSCNFPCGLSYYAHGNILGSISL